MPEIGQSCGLQSEPAFGQGRISMRHVAGKIVSTVKGIPVMIFLTFTQVSSLSIRMPYQLYSMKEAGIYAEQLIS